MELEPKIIFECGDFLVIDKPANWHSVAQKESEKSIESWLTKKFPGNASLTEAGLIQRLDYETSGCILAAKNPKSYEQLCLVRNEIQKFYWVLTDKEVPADQFDLYFFSRYRGSKKVSVELKGKTGERGRCRWHLIKYVVEGAKKTYLYEVELVGGGKRHQIRAGFASLGCPLIGDVLYGSSAPVGFLGLHSHEMRVETHAIISPAPEAWRPHFPGLFAGRVEPK